MSRKKVFRAAEHISDALELLPGTHSTSCAIQMSSNREILIDGCRGLLEYGDEKIRVNIGNGVVQLVGRNLEIKSLSCKSVVISGYILSVEFEM